MKNPKINIYLADDHLIILDGLSLLLKNEPDIFIVGSATNGLSAMKEIQSLNPDVALIDLKMPDKDGLQIVQYLKPKLATRFIILSMHHDRRYINDAKTFGADAYLFKNAGRAELLDTIRKVMEGEKCFPPPEPSQKSLSEIFLTPRELDVLNSLIQGNNNLEVANKLSISVYTVETHRKSIIKKTGIKSLIGLAKFANDHNISFND